MAWIYLAASEDSLSPWHHGLGQSPTVRKINTRLRSYSLECSTGKFRSRRFGMTSGHCVGMRFLRLTLFQAAFPARISVLRDLERAWKESEAGLYLTSSASLASADLDTSSWKTYQLSLFGGLTDFSWSSMGWGMMRGGQLFQPSRWEPRTSGDESGLSVMPTPTVDGNDNRPYPGKASGYGLATWVREILPTPTASEGGTNQSASEGSAIRASLGYLARTETLPTPRARDWKGGGKDCLDSAVGGQLNPQFVEAIMGYPIGWTELNALVTPWFRTRRGKRSKD
jgi:hypothetical protein